VFLLLKKLDDYLVEARDVSSWKADFPFGWCTFKASEGVAVLDRAWLSSISNDVFLGVHKMCFCRVVFLTILCV
jgi:hypothetical protein